MHCAMLWAIRLSSALVGGFTRQNRREPSQRSIYTPIEKQHVGRSCASLRPGHSCIHAHQVGVEIERRPKSLNQGNRVGHAPLPSTGTEAATLVTCRILHE